MENNIGIIENEIVVNSMNEEFIFLPFYFFKKNEGISLSRKRPKRDIFLENSNFWEPVSECETRYLLKYMTEKMDYLNPDECLCCHYTYNGPKNIHVKDREDNYLNVGVEYFVRKRKFTIERIHMFMFASGIGILVYQIHFEDNTPEGISDALFDLKNVGSFVIMDKESNTSLKVLDCSKALTNISMPDYELEYFYYVNAGRERAHVLSYVYVEEDPNEVAQNDELSLVRSEQLFRLGRCISSTYFIDYELEKENDDFIYKASPDVFWAVTDEAAGCRISVNDENRRFRRGIFYNNLNKEYLFMYIMLLHQKYALYYYLTVLGVDRDNDVEKLDTYREELGVFETNYMFSYVSEVPQYQKLYDRVMKAFRIRDIFNDVLYPVKKLSQIRQEKNDKRDANRDMTMNIILFILAIFGIVSAIADMLSSVEVITGIEQNAEVAKTLISQRQMIGYHIILAIVVVVGVVVAAASVGRWIVSRKRKNRLNIIENEKRK